MPRIVGNQALVVVGTWILPGSSQVLIGDRHRQPPVDLDTDQVIDAVAPFADKVGAMDPTARSPTRAVYYRPRRSVKIEEGMIDCVIARQPVELCSNALRGQGFADHQAEKRV